MSDERDYFWGRVPGRNYVSRRFGTGDNLRFFTKTFDGFEAVKFATVRDEVALRQTEVQRKEIRATVTEDEREVTTLVIQRFSRNDDPNTKLAFSFVGKEIEALKSFIAGIKTVPLEHDGKTYVTDEELREIVLSRGQVQRLLLKRPELVQEIAESEELPAT